MSDGSGLFTSDRRTREEASWGDQADWVAGTAEGVDVRDGGLVAYPPSQYVEAPDVGDLYAHFDAVELSLSDGDAVPVWLDATGNGHNLTAGEPPRYLADGINGHPAVSFDGKNDFLYTTFAELPQPNHIFVVAKYRSVGGSVDNPLLDGYNTQHGIYEKEGDWRLLAGNWTNLGNADLHPHVFGGLFNGPSSVLRVDGTNYPVDAGTEGLDGFSVGVNKNGSRFGSVDIGEILIYPTDKSSEAAVIESYLANKWGIALSSSL